MSKAPSIHSATVILAVFLCLGIRTSVLDAGETCWHAFDKTCLNAVCSYGLTKGCERMEFVPALSGFYTLKTDIGGEFDDTRCAHFQSCATVCVIEDHREQVVLTDHTNACNIGECESTGHTGFLEAGRAYVLYVCKIPCPDGASTCEETDGTFFAHAYLHLEDVECEQ